LISAQTKLLLFSTETAENLTVQLEPESKDHSAQVSWMGSLNSLETVF